MRGNCRRTRERRCWAECAAATGGGDTHENLSKIHVLIPFMFDLDCDRWSYYRGLLSV